MYIYALALKLAVYPRAKNKGHHMPGDRDVPYYCVVVVVGIV